MTRFLSLVRDGVWVTAKGKGMLKAGTGSRLKLLGCLIVLTLMLGIGIPAMWIVWPAFVYPPLLLSLPAPPELLPGSTHFGGAGLDFRGWDRIYDVDQSHGEVVAFFRTELARRGWELTEEKNEYSWNRYLQKDVAWSELAYQGPYIFRFNIRIEIGSEFEEEEQVGSAHVLIHDQP